MSVPTSTAAAIYTAIKQMEGANPANNNPGNVMDLAYYQQTGLYRPQVYATQAQGDAAALSLIQTQIDKGLTLDQFFTGVPGVYGGYAPAGTTQGTAGNNPQAYAAFVAGQTGLPQDVPLSSIGSGGGGGTQYATAGASDVVAGDLPPIQEADASSSGLWLAAAVLLGLGIAMAVGD